MSTSRVTILPSLQAPIGEDLRGWLALALVAGLGIGLIAQSPLPLSGLIALLVSVLVWVMLYRVASEVLLVQATGRRGSRGAAAASDGLAGRHIALWLLATLLVVAFTMQFGPLGTLAACVLLALALPAATIVLTLSGSLLEALRPDRWVGLMQRLGGGDFSRLCGLLFAAALVYMALNLALSAPGASPLLRGMALFASWTWCLLAWFHFAGRVVHAHRAELGLDAAAPAPQRPDERYSRDPEQLWATVMQHGGSAAQHAELVRVLEREGDPEHLLAHARRHIPALLLAFEDIDGALERSSRMLELDPGFLLDDTDTSFALIGAAVDAQRASLVARLVTNYLARFPRSVKANRVRLLGCEALAGRGANPRNPAVAWFRELMTAKLDESERARLEALAPHYLPSPASFPPL
ncbi:MAG: hypothetical protein RQ729_04735 [Wenzhouxiangellaceae bacterium]|nr:hypothetical protein [Wenzhouxiangellaceae bacterium]